MTPRCGMTPRIPAIAEHAADNATLFVARLARGITLVHRGGREREDGLQILPSIRGRTTRQRRGRR